MQTLERITNVRLPFDARSKNHGVHGLDVWFILKGPKGAVQFLVNFGVYLPSVTHIQPGKIQGFDVGYHSLTPTYDGQPCQGCNFLEGGKCYYDGSGLRADEWAKEIFSVTGGPPEDVLWRKLEAYYDEVFGSE